MLVLILLKLYPIYQIIPKYLNYFVDSHKFKDLMGIVFTNQLSILPPTYFILDNKR